ncbi:MAG: addiction module protein [Clostridiales bacterium]|nr:MAG: addiction module protein [Clostridiales bacterium]
MDKNMLKALPPEADIETKKILKQLAKTNRSLAELKGFSDTIPNKNILINAILINEAKDSSEIENIVTTHDEIYRAMSLDSFGDSAAKEVVSYRAALWHGYNLILKNKSITTNMIVEIQSIVEGNSAGIRRLPGTVLRNDKTCEVVYAPPSSEVEIRRLLGNLENYMNEDDMQIDPLIKLAVIHYQFESIHPFYDGNGRTGRIINMLYLVLKNLIESPILYLSKYIITNKLEYYNLLQEVRTEENWEDWIIYVLKGVEETSRETLEMARRINHEVQLMTNEIKEKLPKLYSKELIDLLFFEFYTKTRFIQEGLSVTRKTAASYLNTLEKEGILVSEKIGKERIYQNKRLFDIVRYNK